MTYQIRETRAYSTKQRPNPTTIHRPFVTHDDAVAEMQRLIKRSKRNDNRSSFVVELLP